MQKVLFVFDSVNSFKFGSNLSNIGFDVDFLIADTPTSRKIKVDNLTDSYIDIIDILSHTELERLFLNKRDYYDYIVIHTDQDELNVAATIFFSKILKSNFFAINQSINYRFIENALLNSNVYVVSVQNMIWQSIFEFIAFRKRQDRLLFVTSNGLKLQVFKYKALQLFDEVESRYLQNIGYVNDDDVFVPKAQKDRHKKIDIAVNLVMNENLLEDAKNKHPDMFLQKCLVGLFTDLLPSEIFYKLKVHRIDPVILTDNFFDIKKLKFYYEMNLTKHFTSTTESDLDVIVSYSSDNYENYLKSMYFTQQTNAETLCVTSQGSSVVRQSSSVKNIDVIDKLSSWFISEVFAKKFINFAFISEKYIMCEVAFNNLHDYEKLISMDYKEIFNFFNSYNAQLIAICREKQLFINDFSTYKPHQEDSFLCVFGVGDIKSMSEVVL